jgi:hypothetical protein
MQYGLVRVRKYAFMRKGIPYNKISADPAGALNQKLGCLKYGLTPVQEFMFIVAAPYLA